MHAYAFPVHLLYSKQIFVKLNIGLKRTTANCAFQHTFLDKYLLS